MDAKTFEQLAKINQSFYLDFAGAFSATRQRLQPGVQRILEEIPVEANILDLGCGNGQLSVQLKVNSHEGAYVGLDLSEALLEIARSRTGVGSANKTGTGQPGSNVLFFKSDLSKPGWQYTIPGLLLPFDYVLAFAVLHHIPGTHQRIVLLKTIHSLLKKRGRFIHSEWQFMNSERLRKRIVPWDEVGVDSSELETGDTLLDWRREGRGFRYVHRFQTSELEEMADSCGFKIIETFESDGEGGRLGLYQIWEKAA